MRPGRPKCRSGPRLQRSTVCADSPRIGRLEGGDAVSAFSLLEAAAAYYQNDYLGDLSIGWERDLGLALALTGCSRAAARLNQTDGAVNLYRDALIHAKELNVDAFALMALIPAAEIAWTGGDLRQAARLSTLVADHPHSYAAHRTQAVDLLARIPQEFRSVRALPDLWQVAAELSDRKSSPLFPHCLGGDFPPAHGRTLKTGASSVKT